MHVLRLALACFLVGAAPAEAPLGKFQKWSASSKVPLGFTAGGVTVRVAALPCPAQPVGDSTCRWDGYNNQATVTVSAPGVTPLIVSTDRQSSYARIAVVTFDRRDLRAGVIVESQYGGSSGDMTAQLIIPIGDGYRALPLTRSGGAYLQGQLSDYPRDLSGDGRIDLELEDGAFDSVFGCNACSPRPPMLFAVRDGKLVDESREPALRGVFAADMARIAQICLSTKPDRNGACAAYVADAARAGRFDVAWGEMLKHYEHGGQLWEPCKLPVSAWVNYRCPEGQTAHFRDFPESLRVFLKRKGYLPS